MCMHGAFIFGSTLRLVFLAISKFSVFGVKRIWRVLILAFFLKNTVS